jgi:hypothetical protein
MLPHPKVPSFPDFRKISFNDESWYNDFYSNFSPFADLSFQNLLVWCDLKDDLQISALNENLILIFSDPFVSGNVPQFSILGDRKPLDTIQSVQRMFPEHIATMLPEKLVKPLLELHAKKIVEDRDNWDYIYSIEKFTKMEGGEYSMLRKNMRRFNKSINGDFEIVELDLKPIANRIKLINSMHTWDLIFTLTENDPLHIESTAIDRLFLLQDHVNHGCFAFYFNGTLEGFAIFHDVPQREFVIMNHIKCSYRLRYMFDFIFLETLKKLSTMEDNNYRFVNMEQDLGSIGLRQHKMTLRPQEFLKKYTLSTKL